MTGRPLDSIAALLQAEADYGIYPVGRNLRHTPTTTAATNASGKTTIMALDRDFPVPPIDAACRGYVVGAFAASVSSLVHLLLVYKVRLGYLTFSGGAGVYTNLAAMPSRHHYGEAAATQVLPDWPILVVSTSITGAVAPVITVGYTDADNGSGRTAVLTLPNNPAKGSGFRLHPHMTAPDRSLISVQSMSTSGGSSGVIDVWGCRTLAYELAYTSNGAGHTQVFQTAAQNQPIVEPGDLLNVLKLNSNSSAGSFCQYDLVPVEL